MLLQAQISNQLQQILDRAASIKLESSGQIDIVNLKNTIGQLPAVVVSRPYDEDIINQELKNLGEQLDNCITHGFLIPQNLAVYGGRLGNTTIVLSHDNAIPSPGNVSEFNKALSEKIQNSARTFIDFKDFRQPTLSFRVCGQKESAVLNVKFDGIKDYLTFYSDVLVSKYISDLENIWNPIFGAWPQKFFECAVTVSGETVLVDKAEYKSYGDMGEINVRAVIRAAVTMIMRAERMIARRLAQGFEV